mgnify:FL=1
MAQLVAAGDPDPVRSAAHKIRGIANNLGASDVGASAEAIESAVLAGEAVSDEQVAALGAALQALAESHAKLMQLRQPVASVNGASDVDVAGVLASLKTAVATSDPGASDLVEELLSAQQADSTVAQQLSQALEMLDNFNFGDVEPLLLAIEQELQVTS